MPNKLYLFANNNEGTAENLGSYRLYNMKIEGDSEGVESGVNYVDYIYGDRTNDCRLDTGLPFTKSNKYVMGVNIINSNSYSTFTGGFDYNWVTNRLGYGGLNVYPTWTNGGESYFKNSWTTVGNEIVFDNGVLLLNGVSASNVNTPFDSDATGNNQIINLRYARLRYFRVYDKSGTLIQELLPCVDNEGISCVYDTVAKKYIHASNGTISHKKKLRDFQPVLDSNGVPCLMDKINKKYYYDKNGKGFRCAEQSEYKRVGYLEGDGNSYINTGIYANPQYKIETTISDDTQDNYENYFGVDVAGLKTGVNRRQNNLMINLNYNGATTAVDYPLGKHKIYIDANKIYIDDVLSGTASESTNTTTFEKTMLLWTQWLLSSTTSSCSTIKIHYFKMWNENSELVLDLIPVLDNEGTPCMYDLVTETFFYNQGTGEFSYGIEESECPKADYVEYLKAPDVGNQIDTGITYDNTYSKIEFKFNTNNCNSSDEILRAGGDRNFWFWIYYGKIRFFNCDYYTFKNGSSIDIDVTITSTECIINGTTYTYETPLNSVSQNMQLFSYSNWIKLYYFRVYDSEGNLIQDLHPSLDNDKIPCMYDTVSDSYFYSNGNDTFEHGKSIGYTPIKYIETNGTQYIDTGVVVNDNIYMDIDYRAIDRPYFQVGWKNSVDLFPNPNVEYILETDIKYLGQQQGSGVVIQTNSWSKFFGITAEGYYSIYDTVSTTLASTTSYDKIKINITNSTILLYVNDKLTLEVANSSVFGAILEGGSSNWALFRTHGVKATSLDGEVLYNCIPVLADTDITLSGNTTTIQGLPRIYEEINGTYTKIHYPDNLNYQESGRRPNWDYGYDDSYLCNNMTLINTYKQVPYTDSAGRSSTYTIYDKSVYGYKETNTTVEPNLIANEGATLTLGSTYMSYLSEEELEQATKNGWIIE